MHLEPHLICRCTLILLSKNRQDYAKTTKNWRRRGHIYLRINITENSPSLAKIFALGITFLRPWLFVLTMMISHAWANRRWSDIDWPRSNIWTMKRSAIGRRWSRIRALKRNTIGRWWSRIRAINRWRRWWSRIRALT